MNKKTDKYWVHHDTENQTYWIGYVVRNEDGSPLFVQQIGNSYQTKSGAERKAKQLNTEAK